MTIFLGRHIDEQLRRVRVIVTQAVREVGEDAAVLLLVADRERQDLALGEVVQGFHRNSRL